MLSVKGVCSILFSKSIIQSCFMFVLWLLGEGFFGFCLRCFCAGRLAARGGWRWHSGRSIARTSQLGRRAYSRHGHELQRCRVGIWQGPFLNFSFLYRYAPTGSSGAWTGRRFPGAQEEIAKTRNRVLSSETRDAYLTLSLFTSISTFTIIIQRV